MNSKLELSRTFGSTYSGKRVLITGHTGFKGSWLAEWLISLGAEVTGFSLPPPTEPSLFEQLGLAARMRHVVGDVRDLEAVKRVVFETRPHFVFHLAAQPLVRLSYAQPVETYATNIMGTVNVLEALRLYQETSSTNISSSGVASSSSSSESSSSSGSSSATAASATSSLVLATRTKNACVAVFITTDKCYDNKEWVHGYREEDPMGGHDPYSSSKGAAELVISAYRNSYFSTDSHSRTKDSNSKLRIYVASARAGNVIGGGDWALDRIVPDCIRHLQKGEAIPVRNKVATRPWQHVLEPLSGYLTLASRIAETVLGDSSSSSRKRIPEAASSAESDSRTRTGTGTDSRTGTEAGTRTGTESESRTRTLNSNLAREHTLASLCSAFNFGPAITSNRTVAELVQEILKHWPGRWEDKSDPHAVHEAKLLNLSTDKAYHFLGWSPVWDFAKTVENTVTWYRDTQQTNQQPAEIVRAQIDNYSRCANQLGLRWAS